MWFAVVFYCMLPSDVSSCTLSGNTNVMHATKEECLEDARGFAMALLEQNIYARPACFKLGDNV